MMSASAAGNILAPEIIEAILCLLPARSLGRFKSVSKTWNSLISDPQFIKNHVHHNNHRHQTTKLILVSEDASLYSIGTKELLPYLNNYVNIPATAKELSFLSPQTREILGSCNGLVLAEDENDNLYLMNPTTQELWEVPFNPFELPGNNEGMFCVTYGFGYDSLTDDYKIVSISFHIPVSERDSDSTGTHVNVYSLRKNSWKKLPNSPYAFRGCGALVNRNYHWLVSALTIVAFSLAGEVFSEIKLPELCEKAGFYDVVEIGGKLSVYVGIGYSYELWVMQEYGNCRSWTRVCSHDFRYPVRPLCLVEGSSRDIVFGDGYEVVVFNLDERRCRNLEIVGDLTVFTIEGTFVESIESPPRIITAPI